MIHLNHKPEKLRWSACCFLKKKIEMQIKRAFAAHGHFLWLWLEWLEEQNTASQDELKKVAVRIKLPLQGLH